MCKINNNSVEEEWRDVPNYEGLYQVSNLGRIKSLKDCNGKPREMILSLNKQKNGYLKVNLYKNGKKQNCLVHRLVVLAFIPNPNNLPCVNHKNENKEDNRVENLEYCSVSYNNCYGNRLLIISEKNKISLKGININSEKYSKPILQLDLKGNLVNEYPSLCEAQRNGFNLGHIYECCRGKRKTHKGFIWKYKTKNGED